MNKKEDMHMLSLSCTASIGVAVLTSSLHLRKNYVEYHTKTGIDSVKSGCYECSFFNETNVKNEIGTCKNCPEKVYNVQTHKMYVNESNKYGKRKKLKKNALLLFMYLHYLHPDTNGYIKSIDIYKAAEILKCNPKTIRNNLYLLNMHGYIALGKGGYPGSYQAFLMDFKDYFKAAKEGGRGYAVISYNTFQTLVEAKDINTLRLTIRTILKAVDEEEKNKQYKERTFKELKLELPEYCTNKTVKKVINHSVFQKIFRVKEEKYTAQFLLRDDFNPRNTANALRADCKQAIYSYVEKVNKKANGSMKSLLTIAPIMLNKQQYDDIANISLQYPIHEILNAFKQVYFDYIVPNIPVENIGALVRTITKINCEFLSIA